MMKNQKALQFKNINHYIGIFLIIFHLFGVYFIRFSQYSDYVVNLTSFNLIACFLIFFLLNKKLLLNIWAIIIIVFGMIVEIIGVQTNLLFGTYSYGDILGLKVFDVPLAIGFNWLVLSICSRDFISIFNLGTKAKFILAAIFLVIIDLIIEPVAVSLDFWQWEGGVIPLYNYLSWLLIAIVIQIVLFKAKIETNRLFSFYYLFVQLIFFSLLLIFQ